MKTALTTPQTAAPALNLTLDVVELRSSAAEGAYGDDALEGDIIIVLCCCCGGVDSSDLVQAGA